MAKVAGDTLDTILLGDLSFPDEAGHTPLTVAHTASPGQAIRPLFLNLGLDVKLLESPMEISEATPQDPDPKPHPSSETPYPTTIFQAGLSLGRWIRYTFRPERA